ncbi:unnamed protein product [Trichobilharzia regenti]|nr:unnamed protein product [Trichobilharzia regenti]
MNTYWTNPTREYLAHYDGGDNPPTIGFPNTEAVLVGSVYLHEVVYCFNEASSLVNCPSEFASQLEDFDPDAHAEDEELLSGEIESQILCPAEFIIPDYKILGDAKDEEDPNGEDDNENEGGEDEDGEE